MNLKEIFELRLACSLKKKFLLEDPLLSDTQRHFNEAMQYAMLSQGKRLRPLLVFASALSIKNSMPVHYAIKKALPAALAIEYIHGYSLVHDDLPAMDNDLIRRGKATVHARYGEAPAILVGDALIAEAFYLICSAENKPHLQCAELAEAAGPRGIVLGQICDLKSAKDANNAQWQKINKLKTARLFEAASVLGALSMDATKDQIASLRKVGAYFGEAYQLKDDLEDQSGLFLCMSKEDIKNAINDLRAAMLIDIENADLKTSDLIELFDNTFSRI